MCGLPVAVRISRVNACVSGGFVSDGFVSDGFVSGGFVSGGFVRAGSLIREHGVGGLGRSGWV